MYTDPHEDVYDHGGCEDLRATSSGNIIDVFYNFYALATFDQCDDRGCL